MKHNPDITPSQQASITHDTPFHRYLYIEWYHILWLYASTLYDFLEDRLTAHMCLGRYRALLPPSFTHQLQICIASALEGFHGRHSKASLVAQRQHSVWRRWAGGSSLTQKGNQVWLLQVAHSLSWEGKTDSFSLISSEITESEGCQYSDLNPVTGTVRCNLSMPSAGYQHQPVHPTGTTNIVLSTLALTNTRGITFPEADKKCSKPVKLCP